MKRLAALALAAVCLAASLPVPAAQISALTQALAPQASPTPSSTAALAGAPVIAYGRTLFTVYAATPGKAQDDADLIGFRLKDELRSLDPTASFPPITAQAVGDDVVILLAGKKLVTVSDQDAQATGETTVALAAEWSDQIAAVISQAMRERRPGYMREAATQAGVIVLVAALVNILIWILMHRLLDRPGWVSQTFVWIIAIYMITDLFPQTHAFHAVIGTGVLRPVSIVLITALGASVLSKLLGVILRHIFPPIPDTLSPEERTERTRRRRSTLGVVIRITGVTIIWIVAGVVALTWIGINLSALLTSAGLLGVIIGLAAQDTMKDLVAGVNILIDDRYGVGDVIQVGTFSGTVERLNLRVTQVRDQSGRLITFPNRSIESVANATARWAQVDFQVGVAYDTDLRAAMEVMTGVAKALKEDHPEQVLDDPQMLGVESYNDYDITLRMLLRTVPGDQWIVARELRLRIKEAFDEHKIVMPSPQQTVVVMQKAEEHADADSEVLAAPAASSGKST